MAQVEISSNEPLPVTPPELLERPSRVVALGGGTGLPVLLRGLREALFPPGSIWVPDMDRERLTAIVTVADDGGSSGRLRRGYRVLPPGDIRNCLLALSDGNPRITALFNFRFHGNGGVGGHSLGNLILTALSELEGDFLRAVEQAGEIMAIRGRVFPSTLDDVTLRAEFTDGTVVAGESRIAGAHRPIRRLSLQPEGARVLPESCEAIAAADLIVIGPGSLYTSVLPVLLVRELADAIAHSRARVALVMNLMSEPGETDGHTAADHLLAIWRHAPQVQIHDVILNTTPVPGRLLKSYSAEGARPVSVDPQSLEALGCRPVERELLETGPKVRHDPTKLARAVLDLADQPLRRTVPS